MIFFVWTASTKISEGRNKHVSKAETYKNNTEKNRIVLVLLHFSEEGIENMLIQTSDSEHVS